MPRWTPHQAPSPQRLFQKSGIEIAAVEGAGIEIAGVAETDIAVADSPGAGVGITRIAGAGVVAAAVKAASVPAVAESKIAGAAVIRCRLIEELAAGCAPAACCRLDTVGAGSPRQIRRTPLAGNVTRRIGGGEGTGAQAAALACRRWFLAALACLTSRERRDTNRHPADMRPSMHVWHDARGVNGLLGPRGEDRPVRRGLVFTIVALALLMMSVDSTIVATALHSMRHGLHTSINWAGWTLTAYSFGFVLILPVTGKLSEQYGCRRVFLGSVVAFTIASLCCGLADNIYVLIALRAIQAAGGAGFTPSATGIIVDHFGDARDRAVSLFGSIFSIGSMIGPIFGGLFVTYWTWRGIFLVNVPIGMAVIVLALCYVPRDQSGTGANRPKMDAVGIALLGSGLLAGMLAVSYMGESDARASSPVFVVPLVLAIVILWLFFRHINRSTYPFIAPRLIHGRGFGAVNLVNGLYGGITSGVVALIPLYATNRYGINALDSGTLLTAQGAAAIVLSIAAAFSLRRTGYRPPLYIGGVIIAIGMVLLGLNPAAGIPPYAWLAGSAFLLGVGRGANNPASRNAGLQLAPEHSSTLAALRSMCMQIGAIITISIVTAILASSADPGRMQAWAYVAAAALLVAALPLITRVPEHHGSW